MAFRKINYITLYSYRINPKNFETGELTVEIIACGKQDIHKYLLFMKKVYQDIPNYKDTFSVLVSSVISGRSVFCRYADVQPMMVYDQDKIIAVCAFIHAREYPDTLQVAFFEALPGSPEAVDLIMEKAKQLGRMKGVRNISIGLQGHVNIGLGILADRFQDRLVFGSAYNPPYYPDYFARYSYKETDLVSFQGEVNSFPLEQYQKVLAKVRGRYRFRPADFRRFRAEMAIYTDLNNRCFADHAFYYPRYPEEDYELFRDLKWFLKEENLIFAEDNGKVVGFILWYPDFNELIPSQGKVGISTVVLNWFLSRRIRKCKIVEIGVLPEYENKGLMLGLFDSVYQRIKGRFRWYETSWILDNNYKSKNYGLKWADREYKRYKVYEMEI
jgi:hypothetical protein